MKETTTYNRKFYLIRKIKADGYQLTKENNRRVVLIPLDRVAEAQNNPAICELRRDYQYGAQIGSCVHITSMDANHITLVKAEPKQGFWKRIKLVDRKYLIGGKWFRSQKMRGVNLIGFKIAIGRFEIRYYLK